MEKFNTLDVIKYYDFKKESHFHCDKIRYLSESFFSVLIRKVHIDSVKCKLYECIASFLKPDHSESVFKKELLNIPFRVQENEWDASELDWIQEMIESSISDKRCMFRTTQTLSHAAELFLTILYILKRKFTNDENLLLVIYDLINFIIHVCVENKSLTF